MGQYGSIFTPTSVPCKKHRIQFIFSHFYGVLQNYFRMINFSEDFGFQDKLQNSVTGDQ